MLELAHITKRDVFYDLGSGYGRIVMTVVRKTKAKYVYGIEKDVRRFCDVIILSICYALQELIDSLRLNQK
jgi:precorrin-6B methylase 2